MSYDFRGHPRVVAALSLFSVVKLVSVDAFVFQATVRSAGSSSAGNIRHARYGVAPRGLALTDVTVPEVPYVRNLVCGTQVASSAALTFGAGGEPFPPGLQLDLRAAEVRHRYPRFWLMNPVVSTTETFDLVHAQLQFVVECSGQNFGAELTTL